jgi:hypothetical protein
MRATTVATIALIALSHQRMVGTVFAQAIGKSHGRGRITLMLKPTLLTALFATTTLASSAVAQTWDAPLFFSPRPMDDIGVYYVRSNDAFFGQDLNGLKAIWRQSGNINLGLQAGIGDLEEAGDAILLGAELSKPLSSMAASTGLIMSWQLGAGATIGDGYVDLRVPLGVSLGMNLGSGGTTILPYVHPRVSFDLAAFDDEFGEEETVSDFGFAADLGVDVGLGERFVLKAAYTIGSRNDLGKRDAFGIGAALRIPRRVVVR